MNEELQWGLSVGNGVVLKYDVLAEDNLEKPANRDCDSCCLAEGSERVDSLQVSLG